MNTQEKVLGCQVAVVGASLGGVMAAYAAAKEGRSVVLTEQTDWIGGQLTSQAVPLDEHRWIEQFGCTRTYRQYRDRVREFYRTHYPMTEQARNHPALNVAQASVSRLGHEPRVALHLLNELLLPYVNNGRLTILLQHRPVAAQVQDDQVKVVTLEGPGGQRVQLHADYFLDATDIGELLPLTDAEYFCGAESREMSGEVHVPEVADPADMQPVTWVAAVDYRQGEDHTIERPAQYDFWKGLQQPYDKYPVLSWYGPDSSTGKAKKFGLFTDGGENLFPLWDYRRMAYPGHFEPGFYEGDIVLINWPQNDYFLGNLFDDPEADKHWEGARELTRCFIYWMQTEAPREDGGKGYPGIRMRGDVLGTEDGLAKYPYIRESRRIRGQYTIVEQDINAELRDSLPTFPDTVGVGCYHIDLHITTRSNTFCYFRSWPFEIPLGAMIPVRLKNLIPACKNISTTHLTNGCFRLHPVEWNIGEVAGYLASAALAQGCTPAQIRNEADRLRAFQDKLVAEGIELHWPADKVHAI